MISVVTPIYNESGNIKRLIEELQKALGGTYESFEIVAVDDGSTDNSFEILEEIARTTPVLKVVRFRRNFGQTAALAAGIELARGEYIVTIDSDLENSPSDIPRLLACLEDDYDLVSGWRKERWAKQRFTRKIPSYIANKLISWVGGVPLHDYGCMLKAYRREIITDLPLYGEMHRFIPIYVSLRGGRITELVVDHKPRQFGKSNYGMLRTFSVLLDLLFVKFFIKYMQRPMHFFGGIGFIALFLGGLAGGGAIVLKILDLRSFVETPLPTLSALFIIVGVQLAIVGILAEVLMRSYYETQNKKPYEIKQKINI